jgi:hypothetical protein
MKEGGGGGLWVGEGRVHRGVLVACRSDLPAQTSPQVNSNKHALEDDCKF